MIAFIWLSLLVSPPILWFILYLNVIAQEDIKDPGEVIMVDGEATIKRRWLTKKEAQTEVLRNTLKAKITWCWFIYTALSVWAISIM